MFGGGKDLGGTEAATRLFCRRGLGLNVGIEFESYCARFGDWGALSRKLINNGGKEMIGFPDTTYPRVPLGQRTALKR